MAEAMSHSNGSDTSEDKKLADIFKSGWDLFEELEHSKLAFSSTEFQSKVRSAMEQFETATRIVSQIGLFSSNELIDEVQTDSLQYMLLPYFLGKLTTKLNEHTNPHVFEVAEVYFTDHLQRCGEYELCEPPKRNNEDSTISNHACSSGGTELKDLIFAGTARNAKIAQYRRMKELEEYINKMKVTIKNSSVDDEVKREFFLKFLDKSIIDAKDELQSVKALKEMARLRLSSAVGTATEIVDNTASNQTVYNEDAHSHAHSHSHGGPHQHRHFHYQPNKPKPLQPFIITRNSTQKAVFGLGYPSLPVMSVDEFYQQRVDEGIFPDEAKVAKMNQAQAIAAAQDPNEKEDAENAELELKIENDDSENLSRMRRMDEYKDVVRRGDGNRYNRS